MMIDVQTVALLNSVLGSSNPRRLFTAIAKKGIAESASLSQDDSDAAKQLDALEAADLIGSAKGGARYYVTAKGLKVARDLKKLPIG
jgi:hypothetical protein